MRSLDTKESQINAIEKVLAIVDSNLKYKDHQVDDGFIFVVYLEQRNKPIRIGIEVLLHAQNGTIREDDLRKLRTV